ncbi:hypothetical protein, partial [Bordetella pertussis]
PGEPGRSTMTTRAPAASRRRAAASPRPDAPPVTSAVILVCPWQATSRMEWQSGHNTYQTVFFQKN